MEMNAETYSVSDAVSYSTAGAKSDTRLVTIWDEVSGESYNYNQREILQVKEIVLPDGESPNASDKDWIGYENESIVELKVEDEKAIISFA